MINYLMHDSRTSSNVSEEQEKAVCNSLRPPEGLRIYKVGPQDDISLFSIT